MFFESFDVPPPTTIVFVRDGDIWSMHSDGSSLFQLTTGPDIDDSPELSRDGNKIAFVRTNPDRTVFPSKLVWVMDANGTNQHQVNVSLCDPVPNVPACFPVLRDTFPTWSPDGTQIAFARETDGPAGIWVMNADGSNAHSVVRVNEPRFSYAAWSPDGTQIAYALDYVCCSVHVGFVSTAGTAAPFGELIGPLNPVDSVTFDQAPSWSPDGSKMAFYGKLAINGTTGIWVAAVGGGRASAVQLTTAGESNPSYSPDGSRIAFNRGGNIWTMNADGSDQVLVAAGGDPSWGPSL